MALDGEVRSYLWVYLGLMALLALTVATAYVNLGTVNVVLNLGVGLVKAVLIAVFFMHLNRSTPMVRLAAASGLLCLCLLMGLSLTDYLSRPEDRPIAEELHWGQEGW